MNMREISTHKVNGCNDTITLEAIGQPTRGGAPSEYHAVHPTPSGPCAGEPCHYYIKFQDGPPAEVGTNGLTHEVLLAILTDRLQCFQRGDFACRENAIALTHLEDAMHWLQHRTRTRVARGVEGSAKP